MGNSFYCNSNNGIELSSDANNNQVPPNINVASISVINGTGTNGETIEVYVAATDCSDTPCQGSVLIGRATVVGSTWRLDAPFLNNVELQGGDQITALSTSSDGATSEFSECRTLGGVEPPPNCSLNLGISNFNNETCAGNDGTFTLTVSNATEPIAFDFGDGATQNPVFSNLTAGSYSVTATDAQGCTAGLNVTISQDPTPALSLVSTDNENCGSNDGSFTVVANGGQAPYIYELDNGFISRTPTFGNLTAGDYTVSVVDANNCIATETLTIQQIGNVNVTIADMQNDVCNNGSGSFKITPSGGQAPYTYNAGNGTLTSNEFTGLSAGVYSVTVADANNCSTIATVNIESGTPPVASISGISQATCSQTGSVSIAVAGGRAPFQFNIGEGDTPQPTFSNLVAGNYVVTVTDANNCSTTQVVTIEAPESPTLSLSGVQIAACGNANGLVIVQSTGGLAPYTYDIGQGLTDNNNFSGLAAGNYTVTVYDANSCTDEIEVTVDNSPTPTLSIATMQDASCNLDNGMITVAGTGVAPLSYDIGNGASDSPTFSNLAADTYTITLTDGNNCVASATIELKSSGGPQINVQSTSEARCDKDNGSFSVNAFGGFPPYTYDIGNGPTNNPEFVDLPGGNYTVTLTDNNGCTASQTITLGNLPAPTFGIGNITDATCGEPNGGFNVSAFGGRAPYQFNIGGQNTDDPVFTDLNEGTYTVVVTDANNCSTALNVTVEGTPTPEVSVTNELVANCGATDGGFDLNVTGGVAPYFFDLGNGESTNSAFRDLAPGAYDVTITDASNCSQVKTVKVQGSADIELSITNNSPATCGIANGQFTVNASGGQTPYTYSINGATATSTATFDNLEAGTYEIRTTDVNGCFALQSVAIDEGDGPTIEVEVTASCGDETAVVNVTASQGQTPYTYDIGEGPTSVDVFRSVAPGLYQVKVVDATGCESSKNISVNISTQEPAADIDILQQPGCAQSNGSIKVNVTRGIPPYVYQMSETEISPFATFSNLSTGNYEITVIDAGGCSTMVPISLGEDGGAPTANFDFNFANFDGSFTNTSQNGTTYTWEFGDGTTSNSDNANHTYATDGTYSICLTATNDCGSDTFCQNHTIQAQNTNKSIEFDFGEISGQLGETVKIPVYVLNFNQAVGFQKSVVIEDPSVAKIVGVSDVNLKDLAAGLFNINDSQFTVAWFEGAIEGVNLPDSTIIYQIEVELLADNACTGVLIADDPLETQVYKKDGNSEVTVDYFTRVGRVCVGEGGNTSQNSQLSGLIMTEDGMAVSEVTVNCTNTPSLTNKLDGTYVFEDLVTPATYTVTPKKNDAPINGVSTFDMVIIQNHILGNERLDSPYKLIAADANNNGRVTVADIIELRKLLLLEISELPNTDAWRFVDASYEFPDPTNPFEVDFPESVTVDLNADSSADFIGIKIGDVNNTAAPNRFTTREERSGKNTFWLNTDDVFVREGESTLLTIIGQQLANISGLQYTLSINPEAFAIEEVYTDKLFKSYNIGQQLKNRGFILASWLNTQKINQAELFSIKITARRSAKVSDFVKITDQFLTSEAYGDTNQEMAISLTFNHSFPKKHLNFSLAQNHPNPFAKNTVITYQLPRATAVELSIFDLQGQRILSTFHEGTKGQNEMVIAKESLPLGGVYYYQLKTPFGQATKKMIVLD
ncbi:MAG: PKD domain-containing protein [Bacteroidota bacterium]